LVVRLSGEIASAHDLHDVITLGYQPADGPEIRIALATLAPGDDLAARTLLQVLLGGLVNLARRIGRDADALDDVVSLAWERIRTYPSQRPGSVSGNVVLDVHKRYRRAHDPLARHAIVEPGAFEASAEDRAVANVFFDELAAAGKKAGVSSTVLESIIRTRVVGESMADLAAEQDVSLKVLWHRRWRAEARLRALPLAS
jgi:DNA-directed RNA polymerase specialized sigma24 family protein